MAAGLRLELKQSQQLVMTPQLQQAIKLLQMSNLELAAFVGEEIERNPLLETDQSDAPQPLKAETSSDTAAETPAETVDSRVTPEGDMTLSADTFDTGTENLHSDGPSEAPSASQSWSGGTGSAPGSAEGSDADFDRFTRPPTLREHLLAQIGQARADMPLRHAALLLAEELDEAGFYRGDLAEFAARIGAELSLAEAALALLQACEPTGVGARSLRECLELQLAERNRLDPAMACLLRNLDLVAEAKFAELGRRCGVDREDMADMLSELRALDPRPGAAFLSDTAETLIPDVFLRRAKWGGWQLELNADTLPRVLVNNRYAAELEAGGGAARTFVAECRNSANWLVKSLEQRAQTILKVSTEIVRHQDRFFAEGIAALRPLTLKMVAEAAGMHESTASRVTANKFIATERGIFELRFFFSNSVGGQSAGGDEISAEAVRHRIKDMIAHELPGAILSDDTIVERLQRDGIDVARRTVAKYRKSLNIPSSVERRRQKAAVTV